MIFSDILYPRIDRKYCGKRRQYWLVEFSSFLTMFSKHKSLFSGFETKDCVANH